MQSIHLTNGLLQARISPLGAELQSLQAMDTGLEYMWQADPAYWGKHSPLLFPIVGTLRRNAYRVSGHTYNLPRHGFAREQLFSAEQASAAEVWFTLQHSPASMAVYPFPFTLQVGYTLQERMLRVTYRVANTGAAPMWFSIGGHPAFKVPLVAGTAYDSHYLSFDADVVLDRWLLQDGLIATESQPVELPAGMLPLSYDLFLKDALVFRSFQSRRITLASHVHPHGLHFGLEGFPHLGIWAAPQAPFVCIEPWCGHADTVDHNGELTQKPGIEHLEPGGQWQRQWTVEVF